MNIKKNLEDTKLTITIEGNLDTVTAPQLESELKLDGVTELVLDIADVPYVSSAGLRVFLTACKKMTSQGKMTIRNAQKDVMDIFKITGFATIFNLE